jgi:hypothetical protein
MSRATDPPRSGGQAATPIAVDTGVEYEATRKTAVIVCHGMGQQIPFDTLDLVARALTDVHESMTGTTPPRAAGYVTLTPLEGDGRVLPRVAIRLADDHQADIFEPYWAPLTEGKVKLQHVLLFLISAGIAGLKYAWKGSWSRWMFGDVRTFAIPRVLVPLLLVAFVVVFTLLIAGLLTVAVLGARLLATLLPVRWPSPALFVALTYDVALFLNAILAICFGMVVWPSLFKSGPLRSFAWAFVVIGLVGGIWAGLQMAWHLFTLRATVPTPPGADWMSDDGLFNGAVVGAWVMTATALFFLRWFLIQYLGDVAAYVSAYRLSEHWELRNQIKETSAGVARAVYAATGRRPGSWRYDRVIVVGHSLGSVIAYDVLNQLIREDLVEPRPGRRLDVVARTPLFLTFGSPLDKTAFYFTTQKGRDAEGREGLAAATQPLIVDYKYRPRVWLNISSNADWIGGTLQFYDPPLDATSDLPPGKAVRNYIDDASSTPILAHNEYWFKPCFRQALYAGIMGPLLPPPESLGCRWAERDRFQQSNRTTGHR